MVNGVAAAGGDLTPTLATISALLLGLGGLGGLLTGFGTRRNYVVGSFRDLTDASAKEAAQERAAKEEERARAERAEYSRDRWRAYSYALRDELMAAGIQSKAIPPTDHPSEAP